MNPDVTRVAAGEGRSLELTFSDGQVRVIDLYTLTPFDGVFEPLNDDDFFRRVTINSELGTIVWPNGADLCPDVLYENSTPLISPRQSQEAP